MEILSTVILEELQRQNAMLQKTLTQLTEQNRHKDERIAELTQMLLNMQRARFGQKSEKSVYVLDNGNRQMSMFDAIDNETEESALAEEAAVENTKEIAIAGHTRKKKRTLEEMCANLPVEEEVADLPEAERFNESGTPLSCIGREYIRTELVMERAKFKVVKHYRKVYADRDAEKEYGDAALYKPEITAPLIPHSYVSPSVATDVLVKKYADGMPLYRQEQMWKRQGVALTRGTMANWAIQLSERYFERFWERLRQELLSQSAIHADETVLQVLKEDGRPATSETRMWAYASTKRAAIQVRIFDYRESRKGDCAADFLHGYTGTLITDGYSGYNKVENVVRAGCWAHMQRKWREAMPSGEVGKKSLAAKGYEYCHRMFVADGRLESLSDKERREGRQEKVRPILDEYWAWLDTIILSSGKLKDAVTYARNQKEYLCAFVENGEIEMTNNQVENAIRP